MNAERLSVATLFAYFYLAGYSLAIARASPTVATDGLYCSDRYGYRVQDGVEFMPEDDPCKKCQCQNGFPVMCRSVQCSPPKCSMYESLKNECCDFRCIEPSLDMPKNNGNGSSHIYPMLNANSVNLSIRLVASAVTSLLIFALLIFMIHRLRQRRLLISMRRLNSDRRSVNDGLAYMTNIDQLDIGFEFPPYEDPPPPYSPPKPIDDDDIPADDPPPYELTSDDVETQSNHIIHTETNAGAEVRGSDAEDVRDEEDSLAVSAATAVMLFGNARWMDRHSLRPLSALESFQSELIELSQPNLDSNSELTMSSPVLTGQKRIKKDSIGCVSSSRGYTNKRRSEEMFSAILKSTDSNLPAPSQMAELNHSSSNDAALKHPAIRQMKSVSSTPQVLLKMQNKLAHSSLLKHAVNAARSSTNISRRDRMSKERIPIDQHLFLPTNSCEATSSSDRVTRNLNDLETMCDPTDPLNAATVESKTADDERRVKRFSSVCGAERRKNSLMQRSAPEVSLHFKSSQLLCTADARKEKKPVNLMNIKDKSKPFLSSSSFMKTQKPKYPSRPQSYSGPDMGSTVKGSSMAQNLTGECYNALSTLKKKKKATGHPSPSSCLFVHLVHDDASSSFIRDSNSAKAQLCINGSATTLDNGNNLQLLANTDQSDYIMTQRRQGGLAVKQTVLESTLMAVHSQNSESPDIGLPPSPAQGLLSPDLPVYRQFLRSESITSQASFHSICSETGEKKHTKSVLPKASKGVTVQGTMSTGSGYLSLGGTSRLTDLKEIAGPVEKKDLSGASMEVTGADNCIANDSLMNTMNSTIISTSMATSSLPVQGCHNYSMCDWKVKEDHSTVKRSDPSMNNLTNDEEERSVSNSTSLQDTLSDDLSFSSTKCLREIPNERISECNQLIGTKLAEAQSDAQNTAETNRKLSPKNTELYSNAGEAELNYQSCKVTVKPGRDDKGRLMFKDQLRQGVKDLVPGHKKHSSNRHNEHLNNGKKQKSKHMESFEYLVSRILHQLQETSRFDDLAARQKVQRPQRFGHKFNCYSAEIGPAVSCKSVAKQSRPISLPNTKPHSSFIERSIHAELANLDFANRNNCMLEHPVENDNDDRCQQQRHGEDDAGIRRDGTCHSSGTTPVSVEL